jgi:glucosamine-6-phosphate deaminase
VISIKVMVLRDYQSLSEHAARFVGKIVRSNPAAVLGLATGSTPLGLYRELSVMAQQGLVDFSEVTTFNLDEYYRIKKEDPQSYHHYMRQHFWEPSAIPSGRAHIPDGDPDDAAAECRRYEQKIREAGGIDLQILGIGVNGHIGFNEPGEMLQTKTHLVRLSEETIATNSRFFEKAADVPRMALSMGMGTIMKARRILLLAAGTNKAVAIRETVKGSLSTRVPASLLQAHPRVTVMVDREAGQYLAGRTIFDP